MCRPKRSTSSSGLLISMGLYRLWRHGNPRFGGMQVGFRDLTAWSFLMASAHGAGLMVLPFVMQPPAPLSAASSGHTHHLLSASTNVAALNAMALAVHTLSYLTVMTLAAWIVYRKLGLGLLRTRLVQCGPGMGSRVGGDRRRRLLELELSQ